MDLTMPPSPVQQETSGSLPKAWLSNKEQPRAWFFSFQDAASARKVLPENSKYWLSLNGNWKFNWAPDPDSRPKDFYQTTFDVFKLG